MSSKYPAAHRRRGLIAAMCAITALVGGLAGTLAPGDAAHAATGTTYYVDSVAGSDTAAGTSTGAPWRSLDRVNSARFAPGDSVLFRGGSTWTGALTLSSSGTTTAPITIGAYGTGRPRIDGNATVTNTVAVTNAHDVIIEGLEVTNSADLTTSHTTIRRGIYVQAQDIGEVPGIVIRNNLVHRVDGQAKSGGIGNGGIAVGVRGNTTPTWFSGLKITGNEVADINAYGISTFTTWCASCEIYPAETGIPTSEVSATRKAFTGLLIDQNYVHDVTGGGITPQYADNAVVQYNTVDRAASRQLVGGGGNVGIWWQGTQGILVQYNTVRRTAANGIYSNADGMAFDADMGTRNSTVQFNISDSNNGGFFMCLISAYNNQVRYNLSTGDHRLVFRLLAGCGNTRAYNNTVVGTTTPTPTLTAPGVSGTPRPMEGITVSEAGTNTIADNIFVNPQKAPYRVAGQPLNHYSSNLYWDGTASTATAANDAAAVIGDPGFAQPTATLPSGGFITPAQYTAYFRAFVPSATSPARGIGVSEFGQTVDALGTAIPVGAVDAGAVAHAVTATATTSLGTSAGTVANVADGRAETSWATGNSPALPGDVTIAYDEPRRIDAVTIAAAFGQGQGPTSVDVQTWSGTAWVTAVSGASLSWHTNTTAIEYARVALPAAVTTSRIRLVVRSANLTWGHAAITEITASYRGLAATNMGELSAANTTAALTDGNPATSWASENSTLGFVQIDGPPVTATTITLQAAFGQGQGPTSVSVQALNGDNGTWVQVLPATAISWSSNTATVESKTLTLTAPTTATRFEIRVNSANLTWGHVALNEVTIR